MRLETLRIGCVLMARTAITGATRSANARRDAVRVTLGLLCLTGVAAPVRAQPLEWYFDPNINGSVRIEGDGFADDFLAPGFATVHNLRTLWTPGAPYAMGFLTYGTSYSVDFDETALDVSPISYAAGRTFPYVMMYGFGTDTVDIVWLARVDVDSNSPLGWDCTAYSDVRFVIDMRLQNIQPTTPIDILYQYELYSRTWTEHDGPPVGLPPEDLVYVRQTNLFIDGNNLTGERFDINTLAGPGNISAQREYRSPVFTKNTTAGTGIRVEVNGLVDGEIHLPGPDNDYAWAFWTGHIRLKVQTPGGLVEELLPPTSLLGGYMDFSVDIGSDTELSDPAPNGNEMFDPGDIYAWHGSPVAPPGIDGYRNDADWWPNGIDPWPTPALPSGAAPVCVAPPAGGLPPDWFDLDAHDTLDFELGDLLPADAALIDPITLFDSVCVNSAQYLIASYDDDLPGHYSSCQTPTRSSSPSGGRYGTSSGRDEVFGITTTGSIASPAAILTTYPILDEVGLHRGLAPNPDLGELEDDDVDSLDVLPGADCDHLLFSVDHETPRLNIGPVGGGLDPGNIYAPVRGANPRLVVSGVVHLGLPLGTDLNAIEFCWTWTTLPNGTDGDVLTLLFTVDVDDPATAADESGGLDPRMIYASYLNGSSFEFLSAPLADAVDALASWQHELRAPGGTRADVNCDGTVDFFDIDPFLEALFNPAGYVAAHPNCTMQTADVNGDGVVDFFDIDAFLACLFGTCP